MMRLNDEYYLNFPHSDENTCGEKLASINCALFIRTYKILSSNYLQCVTQYNVTYYSQRQYLKLFSTTKLSTAIT